MAAAPPVPAPGRHWHLRPSWSPEFGRRSRPRSHAEVKKPCPSPETATRILTCPPRPFEATGHEAGGASARRNAATLRSRHRGRAWPPALAAPQPLRAATAHGPQQTCLWWPSCLPTPCLLVDPLPFQAWHWPQLRQHLATCWSPEVQQCQEWEWAPQCLQQCLWRSQRLRPQWLRRQCQCQELHCQWRFQHRWQASSGQLGLRLRLRRQWFHRHCQHQSRPCQQWRCLRRWLEQLGQCPSHRRHWQLQWH
mmetsp:Transcript_11145/g.26193  ORF Transcript_11145/g.26193 Transcript_11145/m.26193 type:complete len:251 (+) Transcript_11145:440-1192(+)